MSMNQIFENLFELIHQYLQCHELLAILSVSHSLRTILIPQEENVGSLRNRPARRSVSTILSFSRVCDWRLCGNWMCMYRFSIGSLILDNPEQAVKYFTSVIIDFPLLCMPVRILYRGRRVSGPSIAIADGGMLRNEPVFSNCAEDCFSSLYESNLLHNLCGI